MVDTVPDNLAMAIGELKGAVSGLVTMLKDQNDAAAKNRSEFMEIFKGIRADNKEQADMLAQHMKEDSVMYSTVVQLATWRKDAEDRMDASEKKIDTLWDTNNNQKGFIAAIGLIGSIIGGGIVASIEYVKGH